MYENISYYTIVVLIWCYGIVAYSNAQNLKSYENGRNNQKNSMEYQNVYFYMHIILGNKPSLRDEKRSENMSMLFVLKLKIIMENI